MPLLLLSKPVPGEVTSSYGWRVHPVTGAQKFHNGTDFRAATGTPVQCAADGVVSYTGNLSDGGLTVKVLHAGNVETVYLHNSRIDVQQGQAVSKGQRLSLSGATGQVTGPHCHFSVKVNGAYTDPMEALSMGINTGTGEVNSLTVKSSAANGAALGLLLLLLALTKRRR